MKRIIALVDCDSFFVSCEQVINPDLQNKAVCVVGGEQGCVLARSKEAKKLGVKMGMPYFMAKVEFPNVIYLKSNHSTYREFSKKVIDCLKKFSPDIEVYSIDEAFIDLTGTQKLHKKIYIEIAKTIRETILNEVGLPVSIGISTSKTLAKLASDKAKNNNGIYVINDAKIVLEMKNTPIEDIWGIGKSTTKTLKQKGILNCFDLINMSDALLKELFGIKGLEMKHELLGETVVPVNAKEKLPKSIQHTAAFGFFTSDKEIIKKELNKHIHTACKKLRSYGGECKHIMVMLRTKDFRVFTAKKSLPESTNFELEISKFSQDIFDEIYNKNEIYRATGIILSNFSFEDVSQINLFNLSKQTEKTKLGKTIDKLEEKYGKNIIRTGF